MKAIGSIECHLQVKRGQGIDPVRRDQSVVGQRLRYKVLWDDSEKCITEAFWT